jgi:hypothetical protein
MNGVMTSPANNQRSNEITPGSMAPAESLLTIVLNAQIKMAMNGNDKYFMGIFLRERGICELNFLH